MDAYNAPAYSRNMDERAKETRPSQQRETERIAPPTAPLLQDTVQRLEHALARVAELIVRVRSSKQSVFGASPRGDGIDGAGTTAKEPVLGDIIRNQTSALHRLLAELEEETAQLINQLL